MGPFNLFEENIGKWH